MTIEIDSKLILSFSPINSLNPENVQELLKKIKVDTVQSGHYIFKKGDTDKTHIYLIDGEVDLLDEKNIIKTVTSGESGSKLPLAHAFPRPLSARAKMQVEIIRVNSDMLDIMLTWDQTGSYSVEALDEHSGSDDETDWMTRILHTRAFHRIPPANIQALFMRMEPVQFKAGEMVIKQGDEGKYFFIIKDGRCMVTRTSGQNSTGIKLATLKAGDSFGEEALISDTTRNANVIMLTNGNLVRLKKEDFNSLLNEPLLDWVDYNKANELVSKGAIWLDVRTQSEHKTNHIKGSIHIPLILLRMKANVELDEDKQYVIYCDTGRRSSAASFLLNERKINSFVLEGGIDSVDEDATEINC